MRLLLHICCGPCSIVPVGELRREGFRVTGYFYNPNVHPYREWEKRAQTLQQYAAEIELDLLVDTRYELKKYLEVALPYADDRARRCPACYQLRLDETARRAAAEGWEAFTTTLLVSPYQDHAAVAAAGREAAQRWGVSFVYRDFRPGYREGVRTSRERGMYRQPYCGCLFSEEERYRRQASSSGGE